MCCGWRIIAASHCRIGGRTLRVLDLGKVAATFTDIHTDTSVRVIPRREARELAIEYAPLAKNDWEAMLLGYQAMPMDVLLTAQPVRLTLPLSEIISRPGKKTVCEACGEEIINGREVLRGNSVICRTCAGDGYYRDLNSKLVENEAIDLLKHYLQG